MARYLVLLVLVVLLAWAGYAVTQTRQYTVANTRPDPTLGQPGDRLRSFGNWLNGRRDRASTRPASRR